MSSFLEDIELASKVNKVVKKYEEENKKLAEENIHLSMLNCELEQWLKEHKQRIDKAIEYLRLKQQEPEWWDTDFMICINILEGGSGTLKEILGDKEND